MFKELKQKDLLLVFAMVATKFVRCLLLLVACHVASSNGSPEPKKTVAMHYKMGNWRPHFGYYPSHMVSQHRHSKHNRTTVSSALNTKLDEFVVSVLHKNKFECSGILLNDQEVLVPKLCVFQTPMAEISVKLSDGSEHTVNSMDNSTRFTMPLAEQLLSEIKLTQPLKKELGPPPICRRYVRMSDMVQQWGWDKSRVFLTKKNVPQVAEEICKQKVSDPDGMVITSAISCVQHTTITKKCKKTHGLPYVWKGSFCGINLMGHNCPSFTSVDVYVRLLRVKSYIGQKIRDVNEAHLDDLIF